MKVLELEISKEKDGSEYMEKELLKLKRDKTHQGAPEEETPPPDYQIDMNNLQMERDQLKTDLIVSKHFGIYGIFRFTAQTENSEEILVAITIWNNCIRVKSI